MDCKLLWKNTFNFLCDKKLIIGMGIGMIISALLMSTVSYNKSISDSKIEEKARGLGMHFNE